MKKILTTTTMAAAFLLALSGCSVSVGPADTEPTAKTPSSSEGGQSGNDDDASSSDGSGSTLTDSAECTSGEPVVLTVDNAAVKFTGDCGDVTISADSVTAEFEQVGNFSVTGENAAVTVAGSALNGEILGSNNAFTGQNIGSLNVSGTANAVSVSAASGITVSGSLNTVSWESGTPEGVDTGSNNTLLGPTQ